MPARDARAKMSEETRASWKDVSDDIALFIYTSKPPVLKNLLFSVEADFFFPRILRRTMLREEIL